VSGLAWRTFAAAVFQRVGALALTKNRGAQSLPFAGAVPASRRFLLLSKLGRYQRGVSPLLYAELLVDSVPDATREAISATYINR
jgi:hypothetical protein